MKISLLQIFLIYIVSFLMFGGDLGLLAKRLQKKGKEVLVKIQKFLKKNLDNYSSKKK